MPERKSMRRIKDCYRLIYESGLSQVEASKVLHIGRSTVWDYLQKLKGHNLGWEGIKHQTDEELEKLLYACRLPPKRYLPDFSEIHKELQNNSTVTLYLLWEEYKKERQNDYYSYAQFCLYYRQWRKHLKGYLRQVHVGGEKVFVDYSGKKPCIVDPKTGEIRYVELFIMAWGASHYLYAEAQLTQELRYWIMGHVRAFEYFGCVPHLLVPDNLKSAVSKACRYDPDVNRTYTELAAHYGVGIIPARPYKPKDKAKVETGVQIIQRWILARLRKQTFYSLDSLNAAIRALLEEVNAKPMQIVKRSRKELFAELDVPHALTLPVSRFVYHEWENPTIGIDYHIDVHKHHYSVPYIHYGQTLDVRVSEETVEVFLQRTKERIALHQRNSTAYGYTTVPEHMPPESQKYLAWTPARLIGWGYQTGPSAGKLIEKIIHSKVHPQQGFRPALGLLRLGNTYGKDRLEAASSLALQHNLTRVSQINEVLKKGLDKTPQNETGTVENRNNIRGQDYYYERTAA
jgi:transposase